MVPSGAVRMAKHSGIGSLAIPTYLQPWLAQHLP